MANYFRSPLIKLSNLWRNNEPTEEPEHPKTLYTDPYWNAVGSSLQEQDDFIGDPNGEPYVVQVSRPGWIPVSALIFAASKQDAIERITQGIRSIVAKNQRTYEEAKEAYEKKYTSSTEAHFDIYNGLRQHGLAILELIESGHIQAEPFDKRCLAKAIWACNDYLA